jgi:hypothetical protein
VKISLQLLGVGVLVIFIWVSYSLYNLSRHFDTFEITEGVVGDFEIGQTKDELIEKLPNKEFSLKPKPDECPRNWIMLGKMSDIQRSCFLNTSEWHEGQNSARHLCRRPSNMNTKLHFKNNALSRVVIECWSPK